MGNNTIQILYYTDDATLFAKNEEASRFATIASTFNMSISEKTQTLII